MVILVVGCLFGEALGDGFIYRGVRAEIRS
jgi:hypothetical protein